MKIIGRRIERPITFSASAELLAEGSRFNESLSGLPTGNTAFIPKGVFRFKNHEEANRHQENCLIDGMVKTAMERK